MVERLLSKETVVMLMWGSETLKLGMKQVDMDHDAYVLEAGPSSE